MGVTITCVEDDPVAANDWATVAEDSSATAVNVLANDADVDGGAPVAIQSVTQPANGTVVITGGGTGLTYQPDADYCNSGGGAMDNFTYTVNGGSTATVFMTVSCAGSTVGPTAPPTATTPSVITPPGQRLDVQKMVMPRSVGQLARKGIKLLFTCRLDCRAVVRVSVTSGVMRRMGLRKPQIASGSTSATAGQQTWVTATLTRQARAAMLRYGGGGRLNVVIEAVN